MASSDLSRQDFFSEHQQTTKCWYNFFKGSIFLFVMMINTHIEIYTIAKILLDEFTSTRTFFRFRFRFLCHVFSNAPHFLHENNDGLLYQFRSLSQGIFL